MCLLVEKKSSLTSYKAERDTSAAKTHLSVSPRFAVLPAALSPLLARWHVAETCLQKTLWSPITLPNAEDSTTTHANLWFHLKLWVLCTLEILKQCLKWCTNWFVLIKGLANLSQSLCYTVPLERRKPFCLNKRLAFISPKQTFRFFQISSRFATNLC